MTKKKSFHDTTTCPSMHMNSILSKDCTLQGVSDRVYRDENASYVIHGTHGKTRTITP